MILDLDPDSTDDDLMPEPSKADQTWPYSEPSSSSLYFCSCAAFSCLWQIALLSHDKRWSVIEITDVLCLRVLYRQKQLLPPTSPFFPLLNCFVTWPNIQIPLLNLPLPSFFFSNKCYSHISPNIIIKSHFKRWKQMFLDKFVFIKCRVAIK